MLARSLHALKARALDVVRRGDRTVLWAPGWMGFGNWAYLWLWADVGRRRGEDRAVLHQPGMEPWLTAFPALRGLTVARADVRFTDRRHTALVRHGVWGESFTGTDLGSFVARHLLDRVRDGTPTPDGEVVVNVRRGDYYSDPRIEAEFGFDQVGYVRRAVDAVPGEVTAFRLVSDDTAWCVEHLAFLGERAPVRADVERTPLSDFRALATARRSVITNSTFSYWAAYTAGVLHDGAVTVVAPSFFSRNQNDGRAWHLDPRWTVLDVD